MFKHSVIVTLCIVFFVVSFPSKGYPQNFGRPILSKVAQYTIFGGVGGISLMTIIWATDPLNPDFKLLDMAVAGMGIGILFGFGWGAYSSAISAKSYDSYRRNLDQEFNSTNVKPKDPTTDTNNYIDFGNIFSDDRNYFDQLNDVNDNTEMVPFPHAPPQYQIQKHDPTLVAGNIRRDKSVPILYYRYAF